MTTPANVMLSPQQGWSVRLWNHELLRWIRRNTFLGFGVALGTLFLLLLFYFVLHILLPAETQVVRTAPVVKIRLSELPPPPSLSQELAPPPTQTTAVEQPTVRVGVPIPVPDVLVPPEVQSFATLEELKRSPSEAGGGTGSGNVQVIPEDTRVEVPPEPDPYEFVAVEREPSLDMNELRRRLEYPELARRAGIQGKVYVRVLVGTDGKPKRYLVEHSDNELLTDAAVKAVMSMTFTPAIQNGQPITVWVSIPIDFRLR
ncbi:MAG: TonB family protein [Candidatus Kapabacteria bacterium]|nr:TonB family protein [Candidatus Kapabacteria bacterium]MCS7169218.1 TonB family protein [Candidatus Kapabacteria bacterium]MDW7996591.1 TonB family protein [Bacteroidota bacterium]MDW8225685.1 TonB family protein [Bacteroidota bacterium]